MKIFQNFYSSHRLFKNINNHFGYLNSLKTLEYRLFYTKNCLFFPRKIPSSSHKNININEKKIPLAVSGRFKVFDDSDASVILDVNEEKKSLHEEVSEYYDEFEGINTNRGLTGVYDIEELVDILKRENAKDVFVASVPSEIKYVEYICIVSARSPKHMLALSEFIRRLFKRKRNTTDGLPSIEGKTSKDWMAMDLGNIALHIFSSKTRVTYDLETLWSVGSEFDSESRKPDDNIIKLFERHSLYLHDLKPAK